MNEQEEFNQLQQEIANGKQDIDLDDFAKRFAAASAVGYHDWLGGCNGLSKSTHIWR